MPGALEAMRARRSWSKVTDDAPTHEELLELVSAAGRVADHSSLRPWRLIELRGADRQRLGAAIAQAEGDKDPSSKPLRAPLLIAVVASYRKSGKVPRWEQEAVASGVAHMLSLLLDEAGWGVIWRTGHCTRAAAVAAAHGLGEDEDLLGWLYVGGKPERSREAGPRKGIDATKVLSRMPGGDAASADAGHGETAEDKKAKKKAEKAKKKAATAKKKARQAEKKAKKAVAKAEKR